MRWILGKGLRSCWGCDLGMGVLRLGEFYDTQVFSSWMVVFGNPLVGEAYGGLFRSRDFTMVRRTCCYGLGCVWCDDSKQVIAVCIAHQLEASNVGADTHILPSCPCFHSFFNASDEYSYPTSPHDSHLPTLTW